MISQEPLNKLCILLSSSIWLNFSMMHINWVLFWGLAPKSWLWFSSWFVLILYRVCNRFFYVFIHYIDFSWFYSHFSELSSRLISIDLNCGTCSFNNQVLLKVGFTAVTKMYPPPKFQELNSKRTVCFNNFISLIRWGISFGCFGPTKPPAIGMASMGAV